MPELLKIEGLRVGIGAAEVVRGASFSVAEGACLGLVGESGSGKSMTALAVMGLLPKAARVLGGSIRFQGRELLGLPEPEYLGIRGSRISMVFQEPFTCLNPVQRVEEQVAEAIVLHQGLDSPRALTQARDWLGRTGIPDPGERGRQYPHQWSGGMRQRAMIAMAMACRPALLIADEPTTALDVTVQAQILRLLKEITAELGVALLIISHDLGVIHAMAADVAVMREGELVETGVMDEVFASPRHAYTRQLLDSYLHWAGAA